MSNSKYSDILPVSPLAEIYKKLYPVRAEWLNLGLALKLSPHILDAIKYDERDIDTRFRRMLTEWLQLGENCTWSALIQALRSQLVGYHDLADRLEKEMLGHHNGGGYAMTQKYKKAYENIMKNEKLVLKVLFAKLIFLGPPERGKTLTRLRLENKMTNMEANSNYRINPSTPVAKTGTYLITDLSQGAALLSEKSWKPLNEEIDEVNLLYQLFWKINEEEPQVEPTFTDDNFSGGPQENFSRNVASTIPRTSMTKFFDVFDKSFAEGTWEELSGKLEKLCLLYMKDTGGQPELMDMLPSLIIGPALYLLFCKYGDNLDKTYKISLRGVPKCKIPDRMSSCTVRQNLMSALSSIFSMQSYSTLRKGDSKSSLLSELLNTSPESVVYFVGTYKDKVSSEQMVEFDIQMQEAIKDTVFIKKIVHFVSKDGFESNDPKDKMPEDMERLIYPIDNCCGTSDEIEGLKKFIKKALNKFPRPEIPARWLPFSLLLRFTKDKYVNLSTCYRYGKECRMDEEETDVALWFFHHYTGIIFHFPNVPELKDFVITDTQLVFDSISHLIFENGVDLQRGAGDTLRKIGQISFSDIEKISVDVLPTEQMEALLQHFRIIAPLCKSLVEEKYVGEVPSKHYFMPCVLPNCSDKELDRNIQEVLSRVCQVNFLRSCFKIFQKVLFKLAKVYRIKLFFISGFVPIGLFPSMVASLVGQGAEDKIHPFELMDTQNIRKNFIPFCYGRFGDAVIFIEKPRFYEIIICQRFFSKIPASVICKEVKEIVEQTLDKIITENNETILDTDLMKSLCRRYKTAFDCPIPHHKGHLCVIPKEDNDPSVMKCEVSNEPVTLTDTQLVWFGKGNVSKFSEKITYISYRNISSEQPPVAKHPVVLGGVFFLLLAFIIGIIWNQGGIISGRYSTCALRHGCKPSIKQMSYLQLKESFAPIDIIQELNVDCDDVGIQLNIPLGEIESIWNGYGSTRDKCRDTISYWLKGGGEKTITWETFLKSVRRRGLNDVADRIEQQLEPL